MPPGVVTVTAAAPAAWAGATAVICVLLLTVNDARHPAELHRRRTGEARARQRHRRPPGHRPLGRRQTREGGGRDVGEQHRLGARALGGGDGDVHGAEARGSHRRDLGGAADGVRRGRLGSEPDGGHSSETGSGHGDRRTTRGRSLVGTDRRDHRGSHGCTPSRRNGVEEAGHIAAWPQGSSPSGRRGDCRPDGCSSASLSGRRWDRSDTGAGDVGEAADRGGRSRGVGDDHVGRSRGTGRSDRGQRGRVDHRERRRDAVEGDRVRCCPRWCR